MSKRRHASDSVTTTISGNVSGQVAVGSQNKQIQVSGAAASALTAEELAALRQMLSEFRTQVERSAPAQQKQAALMRVDELENAITAEKPDLTTMDYVRKWFVKYIPTLAGGVVSIVVNPIVGKLVQVAGDALASEFQERFGAAHV